MIKRFFKFLAIIGFALTLFLGYNAYKTSTDLIRGQDLEVMEQLRDSENQQMILKYGRKALAFVTEVTSPLLKMLGVNFGGKQAGDVDDITSTLENATDAVEDALARLKP